MGTDLEPKDEAIARWLAAAVHAVTFGAVAFMAILYAGDWLGLWHRESLDIELFGLWLVVWWAYVSHKWWKKKHGP